MIFLMKYDIEMSPRRRGLGRTSTSTDNLINVSDVNQPMAVQKLEKHVDKMTDELYTYKAINIKPIETI